VFPKAVTINPRHQKIYPSPFRIFASAEASISKYGNSRISGWTKPDIKLWSKIKRTKKLKHMSSEIIY
jgi:hypothetical protein